MSVFLSIDLNVLTFSFNEVLHSSCIPFPPNR